MPETKKKFKKPQAKRKKKEKQEKRPPWETLWAILNCKRRLNDVAKTRRRKIAIACLNSQAKPTKRISREAFKAPSSSLSSSLSSPSSSSLRTGSSSSCSPRGLYLSRFSGCYECQTVSDQVLRVHRSRSLRVISPCPDCGELFARPESLEQHQIEKHSVMELKTGDNGRDIVEIIFSSSWSKNGPHCEIERILKINNTKTKIAKFEEYRNWVKNMARKPPKKHPRSAADGNEQLRFYSAAVTCRLGDNGATTLCRSATCDACSIIRDGFRVADKEGITTMISSKRADVAAGDRAMLVCRVIAGRVKKKGQEGVSEEFDSVSAMDELTVFNAWAILPCFVVVYRSC